MRFTWFGAMVQSNPGSEGHVLWQAGLLEKVREGGDVIGFEPTADLRAMFLFPSDLETLYPLLVELVCHYRHPGFVKYGQLCRKLGMLGLTEDGLERIERRVVQIVGRR